MNMDTIVTAQNVITTLTALGGSGFIYLIVEAVKKAGMPKKYALLCAQGVGLCIGMALAMSSGASLIAGALAGVYIGAGSVVAHETKKALTKKPIEE